MNYKHLILGLAFAAGYMPATQPMDYAHKAYTGLCALTRWAPLACLSLYSVVLQNPKMTISPQLIKQLQDDALQSNDYIPITDSNYPLTAQFLTNLTRQRNLDQVIFCTGSDHAQSIGTEDIRRLVILRPRDAQELETLLHKKPLLESEQKRLYLFEGIIHHELTHIERQSVKRKEGAIGYTSLLTFPVVEFARSYASSAVRCVAPEGVADVVDTTLYGASGFISILLGQKLVSFYNQYDELMADDGIPNRKELLLAQAEDYEDLHTRWDYAYVANTREQGINTYHKEFSLPKRAAMYALGTKVMERFPALYVILAIGESHPPHIIRANRFRKRVQKLDVQASTAASEKSE